ncbi:hypothetical protein COU76_02830 [Candidatus Peregrinibacteria bacterium CG10_big_fil_rev_8_21_14_0_10_49_10]|nr:MAG: hypothetical protein COU76_02830 [Candidatus Peregrinibacteria bacterium CG10_big_fil_rev_8_21_14_0_10_49_10]
MKRAPIYLLGILAGITLVIAPLSHAEEKWKGGPCYDANGVCKKQAQSKYSAILDQISSAYHQSHPSWDTGFTGDPRWKPTNDQWNAENAACDKEYDACLARSTKPAEPSVEDLPLCSDTDIGNDLYIRGSVYAEHAKTPKVDHCGSKSNVVVQVNCSYERRVIEISYSCPAGEVCSNGICVSLSPASTPNSIPSPRPPAMSEGEESPTPNPTPEPVFLDTNTRDMFNTIDAMTEEVIAAEELGDLIEECTKGFGPFGELFDLPNEACDELLDRYESSLCAEYIACGLAVMDEWDTCRRTCSLLQQEGAGSCNSCFGILYKTRTCETEATEKGVSQDCRKAFPVTYTSTDGLRGFTVTSILTLDDGIAPTFIMRSALYGPNTSGVVRENQSIDPFASIETGDSEVTLQSGEGIEIRVPPYTEMNISIISVGELLDIHRLHLEAGALFVRMGKTERQRLLQVDTKAGSARATGTEFHVAMKEDGTMEVETTEGTVQVTDSNGENVVAVPVGKKADVKEGEAPLVTKTSSSLFAKGRRLFVFLLVIASLGYGLYLAKRRLKT